ncbi:O-antigen ligase family protein [Allorhodopirellula solitaria]|uniref:O-Antigen ligase n=1 Tax=Allorhodopirellula solitaria TaxID=2527987 RepID=A0A5C5WNW4_9BACT|nr:O-antigen ligase family protein [Allorhodopirellula solitaria]TWT51915.1 O-Antigen ligase [Allorhodopirellula solitaria]
MGALAVLLLFAGLLAGSLARPWVGVFGYLLFAVLCPQWNWRWSLPDINYQKYLAGAALLSFLLSGMRYQPLPKWGRVALFSLVGTLLLNFISGFGSIDPSKTKFFLGIFWKITLMSCLAAGVLADLRVIRIVCVALVASQGFNAFNINQLYYQNSFLDIYALTWNFLDNNTYSISTLPIMALAIGLIFADEKRWVRYFAGVVLALQLHQLMLLESRGTMLGAILLLAIAIIVMPKTRFNWTVVGVSAVAVVVLAGPPVVAEFSSIFASEDELDTSADSRYYLWQAGFDITMDNPLLGVGPWAGELLVPSYYRGNMPMGERKALHNLFFEMSTGAGVPALLLYFTFFFATFGGHWRLWRSRRSLPAPLLAINIAVLCGIPGYFLASMFSSGILIESPYLLVALGIAAVSAQQTTNAPTAFGQLKSSMD